MFRFRTSLIVAGLVGLMALYDPAPAVAQDSAAAKAARQAA